VKEQPTLAKKKKQPKSKGEEMFIKTPQKSSEQTLRHQFFRP